MHESKCIIISDIQFMHTYFVQKNSTITGKYTLVHRTSETKYFSPQWKYHITEWNGNIISPKFPKNRQKSYLGMVRRSLGPCKPEVKDTAYNMVVRPKLEYASPIWNPHTSSQIIHLQGIQYYNAARFVANDHRRTTTLVT